MFWSGAGRTGYPFFLDMIVTDLQQGKPMKTNDHPVGAGFCLGLALAVSQVAISQEVIWQVGMDDNGWPCSGTGLGGPEACFVQETGATTPLPGNPYSNSVDGGVDNDYYFAGTYYYTIEGNGVYDPVGWVDPDEELFERAFTPGDTEFRIHFNLPANLKPTDLLAVTFDANNFETEGYSDPRRGVSVYFNGVLVQEQIVIRPAQLDVDYTTPAFTLASVNAQVGPDHDNIVTLRGTDYSADGGGRWMGIDYIQLTKQASALPVPVFPWSVGSDDDGWPAGDGGGANATFVEGNGSVNALPGSPTSTETAGGADNDYYFAGNYATVIAGNGTYTPVGMVPVNEEAAQRGFAGEENELRYHFNFPTSVQPTDLVAVTFEPLELDTSAADARYGVEVYVNGVLVQPEVLIRPAQLKQPITTASFTVASVNGQAGLGPDNIVTLRGISYSTAGGGNSLGLDYIRFKRMPPLPVVPWSVGRNDNAWPVGDGGGRSATFVQENGTISPLPGIPNSPEVDQQADNDYYFAGIYNTVIAGNGTYTPVGDVPQNEEAAERAFAAADNDLRYHFNLPSTLSPDAKFTFSFEPMNLDDSAVDPRYGAAVYVNGVEVMPEVVVRMEDLNRTIFTPPFTLAQVNAQVGPGPDNIVSLRGINYNADGGGNWMGVDYVRLDPVLPAPFPVDVGRDDNGHGGADGGGANAFFLQEAGVNPLPGNPASAEIDAQNDDDYYLAGEFTKVIPQVVQFYDGIEYEPVGTVLVNEYAAERAFAGSDNELRYHFNLPASLKPTDQLVVSFDALSLDTSEAAFDPRYGAELYFNGAKVLSEVVIRAADFDKDFMTEPFTLASVNAQVGPGWDNVVTLRGINYNADGGGNWLGIDYVAVDTMPQPVFPWAVGMDDNGWPVGDGGGPNATFVQETGTNPPPGNPKSREVNLQADDDYYLAGVYTSVLPANEANYGPYEPAGIVPRNEEAAERAFAGTDNDLRYHFNLPASLNLTDQVEITFDAFNLDESGTDPRYGIEIYVNSVLVQPELVIRPDQIDDDYTTAPFTLASVNAQLGPGADNIVHLKGINYNADGGGNWMGIDYVRLDPAGGGQPLEFTSSTVSNGRLTLTWTGTGGLESAPTVTGPWTPVSPAPSSPYTEDVQLNQTGRFYRLKKP